MIEITLSNGTQYTATLTRSDAPRFRLAWDDELEAYGFKCRTQSPDFTGPDNPPAVLRFYPTWEAAQKQGGDYRVNLTKDPAWKWEETITAYLNKTNADPAQAFRWWVNSNTAQFNTTGWPMMAYVGMSGNIVNVLERRGDWFCFETLKPADWQRARLMSIQTHPHLIHRFTLVTWVKDAAIPGGGFTRHIEGTGTPRGQWYFPLVTNEGRAWSKFVVMA